MTGALSWLALLAIAGGAIASSARWLRVAQREHYLKGWVLRFAARWWSSSPLQMGLAVAGLGCFGGSAVFGPLGLGLGAILIVAPIGLSVRGRSTKLVVTKRLRRLVVVLGAIEVLAVALAGIGGLHPAVIAAGAVGLAVPLEVEAAMAICAPLEERSARAFVEKAQQIVRQVDPLIVAITGSYGKTSTKGYVAHLLSGRFQLVASPRSFNNRAGLSRTVNELLVPGTEVLVAEMGTYGVGEIAALCEWLPPKIAVITAIGPMHLERFGSLEVTLKAKSEITDKAETVVLNIDDERLVGLGARLRETKRVITCSGGLSEASADVVVEAKGEGATVVISGIDYGSIAFERGVPVALSNVACAIGVALGLGCEPAEILARLPGLPQAANRLEPGETASGVLVLDDTFNANPVGARLGLARLEGLAGPGSRRVVVTPGLIELGPVQAEENEALGEQAAKVGELVVVGRTNRRALVRGARRQGRRAVVVARREDAVAWVREQLHRGDAVLYENDLPDHFP